MKVVNKILILVMALSVYSLAMLEMRLLLGGFTMPPFILVLFTLFLTSSKVKNKVGKSFSNYSFLFLGFLTVALMSNTLNAVEETLSVLLKYSACLLISFLTYIVIKNNKSGFPKVINALLICSAAFVALHCLFSYFSLNSPYLSGSVFIKTEVGKNQLAAYLAVVSSLTGSLLFLTERKLSRTILISVLVVHVIALFYTYSRSALICFFLSFILAFVLSSISFRKKVRIFAGLSILSIVISIFSISIIPDDMAEQFIDNVLSLIEFEDKGDSSSISVRSEMIGAAMQLFYDKPLLGGGSGSFFNSVGIASHSTYLQMLSELGILGLLIYTLFIMYVLVKSFKLNQTFFPVCVCISLIMLFQNLADSMLVFLIFGASLVYYSHPEYESFKARSIKYGT